MKEYRKLTDQISYFEMELYNITPTEIHNMQQLCEKVGKTLADNLLIADYNTLYHNSELSRLKDYTNIPHAKLIHCIFNIMNYEYMIQKLNRQHSAAY